MVSPCEQPSVDGGLACILRNDRFASIAASFFDLRAMLCICRIGCACVWGDRSCVAVLGVMCLACLVKSIARSGLSSRSRPRLIDRKAESSSLSSRTSPRCVTSYRYERDEPVLWTYEEEVFEA